MRHIGTSVGGKILQKESPSPRAKAEPTKAKDPVKDPAEVKKAEGK